MIHTLRTTISLSDTDASGRIFYGAIFRFTQLCFESFLAESGLTIDRWILGDLPSLPVRSCSAEYLAPLKVGERIRIEIESARCGESSVTLSMNLISEDSSMTCAKVQVVHVAVDRTNGQKTALPQLLIQLASRDR